MDNRTRTSPLNSNDSNLHPHGQKENSKKDVTQAHTKRVVRLILGVVDTYSTLGDPSSERKEYLFLRGRKEYLRIVEGLQQRYD
jgi:hypothetical protein